ncbi:MULTISPECIES: helix-turn-helix transcriptional regulator [Bacillus subtilis group]|uniref:helix-turn-helix transcriptional regulator n=1 Tax=Bacillus subtilis group TaxID=653685 RepID=UPI000B52E32B|nr:MULTISPECIES: helix-turn-helix transcriptional regulator [Bacillus subtilis group]MBY0128277.1 helix-turn-helix transcriptional regulator [Bacillus subtilis]MCP6730634.1 helix-turn-helix transcriptional regulator [Bacillus subtilis]NLS87499.1 XRE family transcriptional regulator [Bacillus subtilis]OWV38904.1 transcriptional regulator [Bacillus spizizenii]PWI62446.1 XRE family transcriptional regulator [Bacillus subtilis]
MREWLISQRGNQSQKSVAQKVNISRGAYANIELGKRNPSVQLAKKIAQELNFDWTIFFEEDVVETKQKTKNPA